MTHAELEQFRAEWTIYTAVRPLCPTGYQPFPGETFARVPAGLVAVRKSDGKIVTGETVEDLMKRAFVAPVIVVPVTVEDLGETEAA
jgi:hypothetical protein